jgi:hypothetical protein
VRADSPHLPRGRQVSLAHLLLPLGTSQAPSDNTRVVRLARGWYRWDDCLGHFLHHVGEPDYIYRLRSTLRRLATGGRVYNDKAWEDGSFGDGSYHWGSTLDRIR